MKIEISEETRVKTGTITIDGKERNYTAYATWNPSGWWIVDVVIFTVSGSVIDSLTRTPEAPRAITAIAWTLDEISD